jgi:hypothetical protein
VRSTPAQAIVLPSGLPHELFFDLAQQAGATDAKSLPQQLVLFYDGAGISAWTDRDPSAETAARTVAAVRHTVRVPISQPRQPRPAAVTCRRRSRGARR